MQVLVEPNREEKVLRIRVLGAFEFALVQAFREAYEKSDLSVFKTILVDLSATHYIDSSALGMLLNLKTYAQTYACDVRIVNCQEAVHKLLVVAQFDKKFHLD